MSGVLGIAGPLVRSTEPPAIARMFDAMVRRGADCRAAHTVGQVILGASRHTWELETGWSGSALVVHDGDLAVVADATLYYRTDLDRALRARGVRAAGDTPSHRILAAYRAWGTDCAAHLEGDFAFVLWDARAQTLFAARDFAGKRPLFHVEVDGSLLVASTIGALRAHPACPAELDVVALAEEAAALTGSRDATVWRGISRLPPGHTLTWRAGDRQPRVALYWEPPAFSDRGGDAPEAAAAQLLALLGDAVAERLAVRGPTALALSGGWDSPAIFAVASRLLRESPERGALHPVSVSFPAGDPGHEDGLIRSVVSHWGADTTWLRSEDIPPLDRLSARAAMRDEPFPHPFEPMNRAIARAAARSGAAVVLDGNGGDQLFEVSDVYLADLARGGHWLELAREWRARGGIDAGTLFRDVLDGGRARPRLPQWLRPDFARAHDLEARQRQHALPRGNRSLAAHETAWQLTRPVLGRMAASLATFTLDEGAEHRSPLYDGRIIRFAASRPVSDRRRGRETKRLLRRALAGLLPAEVLAPRRYRTGVPIRYLTAAVRAELPRWMEAVLRRPLLAELGIVEPAALRAAGDRCLAGGDAHLAVSLYLVLEAELWLRAHGCQAGAVAMAASWTGRRRSENPFFEEGLDVRSTQSGTLRHPA